MAIAFPVHFSTSSAEFRARASRLASLANLAFTVFLALAAVGPAQAATP